MKQIAFSIADKNNLPFYQMMSKSFKRFHPDIELRLYGDKEIDEYNDKNFFYRSTPIIAKNLMEEGYELILKLDADQLILGKLDVIFKGDYDVGTVLNINRVDPPRYGLVSTYNIPPNRYMNCGLVAMTSKRFVDNWYKLCHSPLFNTLQYREQDILNILYHYGDYKVKCFDDYDAKNNYYAWHGLVAKGEGPKMQIKDGKVVLPIGKDKYPDRELTIKAYHWAGGGNEPKMNYRIAFNEELISYIDWILSDSKEEYEQK